MFLFRYGKIMKFSGIVSFLHNRDKTKGFK